jgi:hypothetical protein
MSEHLVPAILGGAHPSAAVALVLEEEAEHRGHGLVVLDNQDLRGLHEVLALRSTVSYLVTSL